MDLLTKAKSLAERVEAEATKADVPVAVCIIDVHGNLVLQHRMSGRACVRARDFRAQGVYLGPCAPADG
ncbi:heme-binding protein [Mesorhizobium sp. URHB0026]